MAQKLKVTEDDLDLLSDEERAGMKELQAEEEADRLAAEADDDAGDDDDAEEGEGEKQPEKKADAEPEKKDEKPGEPEKKEDDDDAEDAGEGEGEEAEGDEAEGEDGEAEGDDDAEAEKQPEKVAARLPPYQMSTKEIERLASVEKELDAIAEKFDDGELTAKEMREQSKTLVVELDELKEKRTIAKMHGADLTTRWYGQTIPAFLADHTEYKKGSLRYDLLNNTVKQLQAATDDPTNPQILVEAHKRISEEFGDKGEVKKDVKKVNGNGRTIPPTLSGVPSSDISDTSHKSEFVHLERLKGEAHERALAKLTPDARERYLMGA